jgi:hypothetical protein
MLERVDSDHEMLQYLHVTVTPFVVVAGAAAPLGYLSVLLPPGARATLPVAVSRLLHSPRAARQEGRSTSMNSLPFLVMVRVGP